MDENMNIAEPIEQDTIPEVDEADAAEVETEQQDTTPSDEVSTDAAETDDTAESAPAEAQQPLVHIRYNHEDRQLSMAEAATLSQKGLAYEDTMSTIRSLAAAEGKSIKEFVTGLATARESRELARLKSECGGNEDAARRLFEVQNEKIAESVKKMLDDETAANAAELKDAQNQIVAQYEELREICHEVKTVKDIPQSVLKTAAEKKISLLDAYLRYQHTNAAKAAKAKETAANSAAASAGPMKSDANSGTDPLIEAMKSGMWG